jgi:peptidoglycan hydrolase-like protein with peptidoglycan-binding domain
LWDWGWGYPLLWGYDPYDNGPGYDYSPTYSSSAPSYNYNTGDSLVAQAQQDLAQAGYYQGAIDGVMGPATEAAISSYQQANGLAVTGTIDQDVIKSLGLQ